jgi:hypothetical protein
MIFAKIFVGAQMNFCENMCKTCSAGANVGAAASKILKFSPRKQRERVIGFSENGNFAKLRQRRRKIAKFRTFTKLEKGSFIQP